LTKSGLASEFALGSNDFDAPQLCCGALHYKTERDSYKGFEVFRVVISGKRCSESMAR
jgi:hypothetical protein